MIGSFGGESTRCQVLVYLLFGWMSKGRGYGSVTVVVTGY